MAHITNKLRGLVAAFVAVFAALALVPGTAFAAEAPAVPATISGLTSGDTVYLYKVVDYDYKSDSNTYPTWIFTRNFGIEKADYEKAASDEVKGYADQMATFVLDSKNGVSCDKMYTASGNTVTTDALTAGQYLVIVQPGAVSTKIYQNGILDLKPVQSTDGIWSIETAEREMTSKSSNEPKPDKTIDDKKNTSGYAVGDQVPFKVTVNVPNYPASYQENTFTFQDKMSDGLTFDKSSLTVKVQQEGDESQDTVLTEGTEYSLDPDSADYTFKIEFKYDKIKQYAGRTLVIEYKATLNSNAFTDNKDSNDVTVEFSNGPSTNTSSDHTDVYTYEIDVTKVDSADNSKKLQGATFDVYFVDDANGSEQIGNTEHKGTKLDPVDHLANVTEGSTFTTDENGSLVIDGLKAGTYYLIETAAPSGYQIDKTPILVEIDASSDGKVLSISKTIKNTKDLPALPTTGGSGTVALTAAGVVLIAGAAAFIVRSRKQN